MDRLADREFFLLAVMCYGISAVSALLRWRRPEPGRFRADVLLLPAGFALHTAAMIHRGLLQARCPVGGLYETLLFVGWVLLAAYLALQFWPRLAFPSVAVAPLLAGIGVWALAAGAAPADARPPDGGGLASLHAALVLSAYGAFGFAAAAAMMYVFQERDLKRHKLRAVFSLLPPMERLERLMSRAVAAGFVLLTLGLALGPFLMKHRPGVSPAGDAKVIWSAVVWGVYLLLLLRHGLRRQGGRRFAFGIVAAFTFVLLTFWGANLLSPLHR